jgi:peptidoglycan/xylan/chitin deacetylase (PgdA/CDA1 family)
MHVPLISSRLRNTQPIVSFTFDDVPKSAATNGAAAIEARGATATYYISGSMVGTRTPHWDLADTDDLIALHDRGHELACHTYSHRRVVDMDPAALAADIERNRRYLHGIGSSISVTNFAYPFGIGSLAGKQRLGATFRSCRSIVPGINTGAVDRQFLRSMPLIDRQLSRAGIDRAMDRTRDEGGWLIFYTHDVASAPSIYGCSSQLLEYALDAAERRNISIRNIRQGLDECGL